MNSPAKKGAKECDGGSVAVVVYDRNRGVLIGNITARTGWTGPGGHVHDEWPCYPAAACAEVFEEYGLEVTNLQAVGPPTRRLNPCKRGDGPDGVGHIWRLYLVEVDAEEADGELNVDPESFIEVKWADRGELQRMADRTLDYVQGKITDEAWAENRGIALTWVAWFAALDMIEISERDLREIEVRMITDGASRR